MDYLEIWSTIRAYLYDSIFLVMYCLEESLITIDFQNFWFLSRLQDKRQLKIDLLLG